MNEAVAFANAITKDGDAQFVKKLRKRHDPHPVDNGRLQKAPADRRPDGQGRVDPAFYERSRPPLEMTL